MLLLAITALAFGLYAGTRYSAAPFVAANAVAVVALVAFGFAKDWTFGRTLSALAVTIVCLQAAFLFGLVLKARNSRRAAAPLERSARPTMRNGGSTIDHTG